MKMQSASSGPFGRFLCLVLSVAIAAGPSAAVFAQTNAAAEAVRQRVEGLERGGRESQQSPQPREEAHADAIPPAASPAGKIDLSYVPSDAVAIVVLRPAKLLASQLAKAMPVELASVYGQKFTGFDPADVDEVVAYGQAGSEGPPAWGLAAKFNKPFKGAAIPKSVKGNAKLGDLGGRRYLQSPDPTGHSFYGPDSKTIVVSADATLRQLVETKDQPKSGPVVDRVLAAPPTCDAYFAVDMAALRPMMGMLQLYAQQAPPETQQFFEAPNLISAIEYTVDLSAPSPMTLVVHANDEASAERLEGMVQSGLQMYQEQLKAKAAADDPFDAAMARYSERVSGDWIPQREGAKLTFLRTDGQDSHEKQLVMAASIGFLIGKLSAAFNKPSEPGPEGMPSEGPPVVQPTQEEHDNTRR